MSKYSFVKDRSFIMNVSQTECNICTLKFTKTRYEVKCPSCEFKCCASCVVEYHKSKSIHPECMSCHTGWTSETVGVLLTKKSHIKDVCNSRNELLLQEQIRMLPSAQQFIKPLKELEVMNGAYKELRNVYNNAYKLLREAQHQVNVANGECMNLSRQIMLKNTEMERMKKTLTNGIEEQHSSKRRCLSNFCQGWIDAKEKCGECSKYGCFKCMQSTDDLSTHVCKQEDLNTANEIRDTTKECPTCQMRIAKTEGCNDMFCVVCKTTFNYRTGKIDARGNSNPMFHSWLRTLGIQSPQNIRTVDGDNFTLTHIKNRPVFKNVLTSDKQQSFIEAFTGLHMRINRTRCSPPDNIKLGLLNLRIEHIHQKTEVSDWKFKISKMFRDCECKQALHQIWNNANTTYRDLLNKGFNAEEEPEFMSIMNNARVLNMQLPEDIKKIKKLFGYEIINLVIA